MTGISVTGSECPVWLCRWTGESVSTRGGQCGVLEQETVLWDGTGEVERGVIVGECFVNSHTCGDDWTACWILADSIWAPRLLGWIPSHLNREARSQNKFKLSIKSMLWDLHADWSQECKLRIRLKCSTPRPKVGMGPETKYFLLQFNTIFFYFLFYYNKTVVFIVPVKAMAP